MEYVPLILINLFLFIFGATIGSFLNVLSDRLPNEESILGRSHCEKCKHTLSWLDLFPLISFFALGAKCRYCKTKLSFFYPAVEIITGLTFVFTWHFAPTSFDAGLIMGWEVFVIEKVAALVIVSILLVIFFADLKYQIIPDSMQVGLLLVGIILRVIHEGFGLSSFGWMLIDGVVVMLPLLTLFLVTKGRGMGFGDVKLAFVIGVLFGLKIGLLILYMSFILGAIAGVILILQKKKGMKSKMAFGPFIVLSMIIALFFKDYLLSILKTFWGV